MSALRHAGPAANGHAAQALGAICGEAKAARYLERLSALQTRPDELAELVAPLYGAELRGFAKAIEKALQRVGAVAAQ